jgi:lysine biosynthesis protein LysW
MVYCPACEADMDLDEDQLEEGGVVSCGGCGAQFEIINPHPLELERVTDDEEDEDDEDDEDFDDLDDEDDDDEDDEEDEDEDDDYGDDEDEEEEAFSAGVGRQIEACAP